MRQWRLSLLGLIILLMSMHALAQLQLTVNQATGSDTTCSPCASFSGVQNYLTNNPPTGPVFVTVYSGSYSGINLANLAYSLSISAVGVVVINGAQIGTTTFSSTSLNLTGITFIGQVQFEFGSLPITISSCIFSAGCTFAANYLV